jgi:hydrogenase maturation protein HypF
VQHHLAHLLACLLEHKRRPEEVLGVVWDGTGYGEDGSVWGGEFLLAREGRVSRFAHVRPFRLPGGGAAARDARRVATALLLACDSSATEDARRRFALTDSEGALLPAMIARGINSPWCTSVGRLFDAVGLILGLGRSNSFEGQIPLSVEAAAARGGKAEPLPFAVRASSAGARLELDWEPALRLLLRSTGASHDAARAFHFGLAEGVVRVAREAGAHTVALSGGCFQNMLLLDATRDALGAAGFEVLVHRQLPPNDGAISAGQAAAVAWGLHSVELKG